MPRTIDKIIPAINVNEVEMINKIFAIINKSAFKIVVFFEILNIITIIMVEAIMPK